MRKSRAWHILVPVAIGMTLLISSLCLGQSAVLDLPRQSQRAIVTQRVGITDITISYHRPLVGDRKIWDNVVPYGKVWRAGANENTTIEFSDAVSIEGKPLDKGRYGLHMIPAADQWTIIFSNNSTSWGSFTYDQKEDALRVIAKPRQADFHEALTYDFDQPKPDSVVAILEWEKIAVPFNVSVKVNDIVESSLQHQLRGLAQYTWFGWDDAANYLLDHKMNLEEALKYSDNSIQNEERFDNLITKYKILTAMGRKDEATAAHDKAFAKATPLQIHIYGRQLQAEKRQDEAFAIFRDNAKNHPNEWFVHSGLARIYCAQGDFDNAAKEMKVALSGAPDQQKTYVEGLVKRLEAKQDINK
jgi:tetratricopeptide (TPR) repeat protein